MLDINIKKTLLQKNGISHFPNHVHNFILEGRQSPTKNKMLEPEYILK